MTYQIGEPEMPLAITQKGPPGIWEQAYADDTEARALIVATADGGKAQALFVPRDARPNGEHALFIAQEGMIVVRVIQSATYVVVVDQIASISKTPVDGASTYTAHLIRLFRYQFGASSQNGWQSGDLPENLRAAVEAACEKIADDLPQTASYYLPPRKRS